MLKKSYFVLSIGLTLLASQVVFADTEQRRQAKRIHDRLTGTPPSDSILAEMETLLMNDSTGKSAADKALEDPAFYNVTLKNFAAPWTNEEQTVFTPLNDYTATVIGMIRDDIDFREVLSGDILYTGDPSVVIDDNSQPVPYSNFNNDHYVTLENLGPETGNLADDTILTRQNQSNITGLDSAATAGIMTTRAAARAFFFKGTSRAMFRFTFMNHLCTDLEPLKDNSRIPDRVHRDVSRSPGGDSRIFLNSCVACHAGMDGFMGAYAYYDLEFDEANDIVDESTPHLVYTPDKVQAKFLINENNFKPGHVTIDDSWINYWRNGQNALLGWSDNYQGLQKDAKGHAFGNGAKTMGRELANSEAFAQCQVRKVFQNVCLREPGNSNDRTEVNSIVDSFKADDYKMKQVFRDVAAYCKGN
ncbi:MAG: hypothetical protein GY744_16685 [Gammaproteobacteria bacterium]|nr:hypothetical protein [Gammaproteobacteria bacterium]